MKFEDVTIDVPKPSVDVTNWPIYNTGSFCPCGNRARWEGPHSPLCDKCAANAAQQPAGLGCDIENL